MYLVSHISGLMPHLSSTYQITTHTYTHTYIDSDREKERDVQKVWYKYLLIQCFHYNTN